MSSSVGLSFRKSRISRDVSATVPAIACKPFEHAEGQVDSASVLNADPVEVLDRQGSEVSVQGGRGRSADVPLYSLCSS
jgi:hypothetical protein